MVKTITEPRKQSVAIIKSIIHLATKKYRIVCQQLPFSYRNKQRIKCIVYNIVQPLISRAQSYGFWVNDNSNLPQISFTLPPVEYVPLLDAQPPEILPARLIAFYLPQFHAIPENDSWWGEGFTEWTNVRPAKPQFLGHYQPHIPDELGYYNLLDPAVQQRQVELAKLYGLGGFCFYFYWFAGKRLLEKPIENYLSNHQCDLPFCLCWANENWSRRWDGCDSEILIAQQHSPEDDLAFIAHISKYMRDVRYIRINGRPLLLVYWPAQLPSPKKTAKRWRTWCRDYGIGEIYLAYTQSFDTVNPTNYGFDAAIEFPPNNMAPPIVNNKVKPLTNEFDGTIHDWQHFVRISRKYRSPRYTLFRGVCPSWDNTARRKNRGTILLNSSPRDYQEWLSNAIQETCERIDNSEERLIFVNAWNEWAEGAHLEPDQRFGYAWLDATRNALLGLHTKSGTAPHRIIVVSHDAHPHGAQFLALGMVRSLIQDLGVLVEVVLLESGRLASEFAAIAPVHNLNGRGTKEASRLADSLAKRGFTHSIINTTVSGWLVPIFKNAGIESICLIHELPGVIQDMGLERNTREIAEFAKSVIFPAQIVADGFSKFATVDPAAQVIRPQGLYRRNRWRFEKQAAKAELCKRLHLSNNTKVVLTVGYADHRKGVDLFVKSALEVLANRTDVDFVWVGHWELTAQSMIEAQLMNNPLRSRLHFVGYDPDTALYHAASDVYALTSREDPFPNVVLESFDVAVPVVAFAETGGAAELVRQLGGFVVPAEDATCFAESICQLLDDTTMSARLGHVAQTYADSHCSFRAYLFDLCNMLDLTLPRISVIVPNYNYARHIEHRLESILHQTLPFYELIILDDASTDDSLRCIENWLAVTGTEARIVRNESNSGNVFVQWNKGLSMAAGDYVWIAEADDLSDSDFLKTVVPSLQSGNTVLSYCESRQINAKGVVVANNYHQYLAPVSSERWQHTCLNDGIEEIRSYLAVMNTIPNVSAVVFNRKIICSVFEQHFDEIAQFRKAGDWVVYLYVLKYGDIAFSPHAANRHRRHGGSVIAGSNAMSLYQEIQKVQQMVAKKYELDICTQERATHYLAMLRQQFDL
jgi:glycosyltransferase involved in cell wall biosynthesis